MTKPKPRRRSIRLPYYDYSQSGAYFVTVCVKDRKCVLSKVVDETTQLSSEGEIVKAVWDGLPNHYTHVELDEFVVMPNHIHGIIWLADEPSQPVGAGLRPAPTRPMKRHGLPEIVRALKSFSARRINELRGTKGTPFWQRNYYEHIIRDDEDLYQHQNYIRENPFRWALDEYYRENN